jgi:membrane protein implicated in regulation of membrane protease activity
MFVTRHIAIPAENETQMGRIIPIHKADTSKKWRVRFRASDWYADSDQPKQFKVGDIVQIVGFKSSTTLLIEPIS